MQQLKSELEATKFAIAKNTEQCSGESGHLTTARLQTKGSRMVLIARTLELVAHAKKSSGTSMDLMQSRRILKDMSVEAAQSYMKTSSLFAATIGPGDCLFIPAGCTFYEKVYSADVIGVRFQVISQKEEPVLNSLNMWLIEGSVPNLSLQRAIDCLVTAA